VYPFWERADEGQRRRSHHLEVAREPNALGVGASYPVGAAIGVDQARELVRLVKQSGEPLL
jgi:hypothetical protein